MRDGTTVVDLTAAGVDRLETVLEQHDPRRFLEKLSANTITAHLLAKVKLLAPVGRKSLGGWCHLFAEQKGAHGRIGFQRERL